jgi:hypothetical protein
MSANDVPWQHRFRNIFDPPGRDGRVGINVARLHGTEPALETS